MPRLTFVKGGNVGLGRAGEMKAECFAKIIVQFYASRMGSCLTDHHLHISVPKISWPQHGWSIPVRRQRQGDVSVVVGQWGLTAVNPISRVRVTDIVVNGYE